MASFCYENLPHDRSSIRLLRVLPSCNPESQIFCDVFHHDISNEFRTPYEALSYTWGDTTQTVDIRLNGCVFPITMNLENALRALRYTDNPRVLWVDAVCIDQSNTNEQGEQVGMMWDIYRTAEQVVVWLGSGDSDSSVAMENLARREASTKNKNRTYRAKNNRAFQTPDRCGCPAGDFTTRPSRIGIQNLLGRPWFTRIWVLQEVAAARSVLILCGDKAVSGKDFCHEIMAIAKVYKSFQRMLRKIRPVLELMDQSTRGIANRSLSVIELIESFRTWNATRAVDKVYALQGLSSDASRAQELQPDYAVPQEVLARKLVHFAFPNSEIQPQSTCPGEVLFKTGGLLLGTIRRGPEILSFRDDIKDGLWWKIDTNMSLLPDGFQNSVARDWIQDSWCIPILSERELEEGSLVVLLRGASRPTVLRPYKDFYIVEMLATPEPEYDVIDFLRNGEKLTWPETLESLATASGAMVELKLLWSPFRQLSQSEVSRYIPTLNDLDIQYEAYMESYKDAYENGGQDIHDCVTVGMLWNLCELSREDVRAGTWKDMMTLHKAVHCGYYGTVKLLLDAGADVDSRPKEVDITPLALAVTRNDVKMVRALLDAKATVEVVDQYGWTPLSAAVASNYFKITQMLLNAGADPNDAKHKKNFPLFEATMKGRAEIASALLIAGADPNAALDISTFAGVTVLHTAAEMGHTKIVEALLSAKACVDAVITTQATALHQATMNGHIDSVKLLLDANADVNAQDENGMTPLDYAVYHGQQETAEVLWNAGGLQAVRALYGDDESCDDQNLKHNVGRIWLEKCRRRITRLMRTARER